MRNIGRLFLEDLRAFKTNVIGAIVVMGLLLTPALYAWFNILGFWDPYAATGNLEVAVANADEGYKSDLLPAKLNAGEEVISQLRGNDQFKWVFTTEEDAVEGAKSGAYYAALVIPKEFTADLMTVFSDHITHADIIYYTNQKENAVAPRVTDQGANMISVSIDKAFTETVASVALGTTSDLMNFVNGDGISNYGRNLDQHLTEIINALNLSASETASFAALVGSSASLAQASTDILTSIGNTGNTVDPLLDEVQRGLDEGASALDSATTLSDQAFSEFEQGFTAVESAANQALDALDSAPQDAEAALSALSQDISGIISAYENIRSALEGIDPNSPIIPRIDQAISSLQSLQSALQSASHSLEQGAAAVQQARQNIESHIQQARNSLQALHDDYQQKLAEEAQRLGSSLANLKSTITTLDDQFDRTSGAMASSSDSLIENLRNVQNALEQTSTSLSQSADSLSRNQQELMQALASGDLDRVREIIGSDPERIADFVASPTELKRQAVYPVANNGSAMSPFYTSLAIWIGAVFMVALMEVTVGKRRLELLNSPTPGQLYLGRYLIYLVFGLIQALIVCLGNVLFLGVQCEHFLLYLFTGCVAALVFTNIVYTLTVSFGRVGESLAIILLVLQVAGSGGIFPVVLSAKFFQVLYPFLPFTHSMEAFQSCIAGIYDGQFWASIGLLLLFLVPMLILGLVLRRPIIKLNESVAVKLEETKLL